MINLNMNLFNYIALFANISEKYSLFNYLKLENKLFLEADSVEDSPVKNIEDLTNFTVLRVVLEDVYKYWTNNEKELDYSDMELNEEKIKENGLFKCIKNYYYKTKNSSDYNSYLIEKFIFLFTSKRTTKNNPPETIDTNIQQDEDLAEYNTLRQKIKNIQKEVAARYRNCRNGSSLFELVRDNKHFGIDLGKYIGTKEEINVYRFLYLLHSLIMLEHHETGFSSLINNLQGMDPNLTFDGFKRNLYTFQKKLFSNNSLKRYLGHLLGASEQEAISRTLCFFYGIELYSIDFPKEPPSKRKNGLLLFNILKNPGLEISSAFVVNKSDIKNSDLLPALYTKFGYYLDNIIADCYYFSTVDPVTPGNNAENKVRIVNAALQFLQKKAFLSLVEKQNSVRESESNNSPAINQINIINKDLEELLLQLEMIENNSSENLFDRIVLCLESTRQIGIYNAFQEARNEIDEWLQSDETSFMSVPDLDKTVKFDDIVSYLNSNECDLFSFYGYNEKEIGNLRSNADKIRKAAVAYCENSLYENCNNKRDAIFLCELDAICYAFQHKFFNKMIKCQGYTLDGTNEKRTLKTVIEDNINKSNNSNNYIYYFTFLNNLINRIIARRGLNEDICNSMIVFDSLILKLGTAIFKKHDESLMRKAIDKILRITLPFFTTGYDLKISYAFWDYINQYLKEPNSYIQIAFGICENHKSEIVSIFSQEILFYYYSYHDKIILTENEIKKAISEYWEADSGILYLIKIGLENNYIFKVFEKFRMQRTIFDVPINVIVRIKASPDKIIIEIDLDLDSDD